MSAKNTIFFCLLSLLSIGGLHAQSELDNLLTRYNTRSVPYISVEELLMNQDHYLVLDTRKSEEYQVSHIPNSVWVGESLEPTLFEEKYPDKDQPIVVYCSVGIRSETFGEQLKKLGYSQVQNLYGSIFAWKDAGYSIYNSHEQPTDSVHVYSKVWAKYLNSGIPVTKMNYEND